MLDARARSLFPLRRIDRFPSARWRAAGPAAFDVEPVPDMMTLDLLRTLDVVDDDVTAVVEAYMADPDVGTVGFGAGYRIDPAEAVAAHPFARALIAQSWASEDLRRAAIRAAILLAEPERTSHRR